MSDCASDERIKRINVELQKRVNAEQLANTVGAEAIARVVGMSCATVYKLINDNTIPVVFYGGKYRSWRDLLYQWALARKPVKRGKKAA
jgi:excisionase family DNA binding protein